jgi:hypothetical protein
MSAGRPDYAGPHADGPRPLTGDRAVDAALADLRACQSGPLDELLASAERLQSTLQQRLASGHGD